MHFDANLSKIYRPSQSSNWCNSILTVLVQLSPLNFAHYCLIDPYVVCVLSTKQYIVLANSKIKLDILKINRQSVLVQASLW